MTRTLATSATAHIPSKDQAGSSHPTTTQIGTRRMSLTAIQPHTIEDNLVVAAEIVSRYNISADEVTVSSEGVTIAGNVLEWVPALTDALILQLTSAGGPGEPDVYRGKTFDGIPVTVEHRRV